MNQNQKQARYFKNVKNFSFPYLETGKQIYGKRALTKTTPQLQKHTKELKSMNTRTKMRL